MDWRCYHLKNRFALLILRQVHCMSCLLLCQGCRHQVLLGRYSSIIKTYNAEMPTSYLTFLKGNLHPQILRTD
jgi:hypothetical protein